MDYPYKEEFTVYHNRTEYNFETYDDAMDTAKSLTIDQNEPKDLAILIRNKKRSDGVTVAKTVSIHFIRWWMDSMWTVEHVM